jgi:hypothetical protein
MAALFTLMSEDAASPRYRQGRARSGGGQAAVVVAVIAVRVMQVIADAIVDVIAMRNRLVTAAGAVDMTRFVAAAAVVCGAPVGVVAGHLDHVLVDMIAMRVVQVTIVQIVGVAAMAHRGVPAVRAVLMGMIGMVWGRASRHRLSSFISPESVDTAVRPSAA